MPGDTICTKFVSKLAYLNEMNKDDREDAYNAISASFIVLDSCNFANTQWAATTRPSLKLMCTRLCENGIVRLVPKSASYGNHAYVTKIVC